MNYRDYHTLSINGQLLDGPDIVDFCLKSDKEFMHHIGRFAAEWLKDSPHIEVTTSGSTGAPKVMVVSKSQMLQSGAMTAEFFGFTQGQNALLCLPVNYIAGKMMIVRAFYSGLNLISVEPSNHPLDEIANEQIIDFAPLIPMQLNGVSNPAFIRKILLGGSPVSPSLEERVQAFSAEVYIGYGMTETLSHVALRKVNSGDRSDVYHSLPGIIFDIDERNCLIIDVPFLSQPVYTNDVVELIGDTEFIWKGRYDNVVISGGLKFYPEEIEKKLFPLIRERFFMAGLADERFGEKLCLFIEGGEFPDEKFRVLLNNMARKLERYEKPRDIFFIKNFQTTTSGKIKRDETVAIVRQH